MFKIILLEVSSIHQGCVYVIIEIQEYLEIFYLKFLLEHVLKGNLFLFCLCRIF